MVRQGERGSVGGGNLKKNLCQLGNVPSSTRAQYTSQLYPQKIKNLVVA